jgi:hypothetical protein
MKAIATLAALGIASAALLALAAPDGQGRGADRMKQADTNGDGLISRDEAKALPRLAKHFDEIDTNHDGQISADEMRAAHEKRKAEHDKTRADHWKKLDTNGDGRISLEEAKAGAPRLAERFSAIDTNGDGFITPEEMKAAHAKRGPK